MKVLILGASGYIGRVLFGKLSATDWAQPTSAARGRHPMHAGASHVRVDTRDLPALTLALQGYDCVVNCVAGDYASIAGGASVLSQAAAAAKCRRIVHLSSMAVYGRIEGYVDEQAPFDPDSGWYARAKCEAESHLSAFAQNGGEVVVLRPGCVVGPGSELWVGRVGRWLKARRLGDLGAAGDGYSNLVHVDDVCDAVIAALRLPIATRAMPAFNLATPDSPRWNQYFSDLAIALNAIPVRRIRASLLKVDSLMAGPPLKVAEKLLDRFGIQHRWLPDPLPPSLLRLWSQDIQLNAQAASDALALEWTGYRASLDKFSDWFADCSTAQVFQNRP